MCTRLLIAATVFLLTTASGANAEEWTSVTYDPDTSFRVFLLESAQPDGSWKQFARYTVQHKPAILGVADPGS